MVADFVERRGQVRVQSPQLAGVLAARRFEDGLDRVMTTSPRPKPIRTWFKPGFPLGFQRVTHPPLLGAVSDHGNPEPAKLSIGLRYPHPFDRPGVPRLGRLVQR